MSGCSCGKTGKLNGISRGSNRLVLEPRHAMRIPANAAMPESRRAAARGIWCNEPAAQQKESGASRGTNQTTCRTWCRRADLADRPSRSQPHRPKLPGWANACRASLCPCPACQRRAHNHKDGQERQEQGGNVRQNDAAYRYEGVTVQRSQGPKGRGWAAGCAPTSWSNVEEVAHPAASGATG